MEECRHTNEVRTRASKVTEYIKCLDCGKTWGVSQGITKVVQPREISSRAV